MKVKVAKRVNYNKLVSWFWLITVIIFWTFVEIKGIKLTPENIAHFLEQFQHYIVVAYFLFSVFRAFTLIPNMTVVFVGTLLVKDFWILLISSVIGLLASSSMIYFFGEQIGIDRILLRKYPDKVDVIKNGLKKYGDFIIFIWGFLPVVPSDLLSFVLGTMRYNYIKFMILYGSSHLLAYGVIIKFGKEFWKLILPV